MRLFGVTMVRNEADIIEAFVRHNLSVLDGLAIVDHGSIDGTPEILAKLQAEGLQLRVASDPDPAFRQSATLTALAREVLAQDAADFVFALDADEFIKCESRAMLERALADVPVDTHAVMHWVTYVPDALDGDPGAFGPGHLWWRLKTERHALYKVIVGRGLLERSDDAIASGNHCVQNPAEASVRPHARLRQDVVALAHCPLRSRTQFEGKIIVSHLAHLAAQPEDHRLARHWRELYAELRAGVTLTEERLREIACNYGLPPKMWQPVSAIELVEDPVPLDFEQRYRVDAVPGPLQLLLRFTETLIAAEQKRSASSTAATRYYTL
jgi:hypothetical protein